MAREDRPLRRCPGTDEAVEAFLAIGLRSEHSRRSYRIEWGRWRRFLRGRKVIPTEARRMDFEAYLAAVGEGKSRAVRTRALAALRSIYAALWQAGRVRWFAVGRVKFEKEEED